jgi:hypothetical protein
LNLCVCGAWTTHNQQTQPSQPAIALTKNTNQNFFHDGLSSSWHWWMGLAPRCCVGVHNVRHISSAPYFFY